MAAASVRDSSADNAAAGRKWRASARLLLLCAPLFAMPGMLRAQGIPPGIVGEIQGADVSVSGGVAARDANPNAAAGIYVANGSEVTVHSGRARMTLSTGGEIDFCGPAKFTPLQSGAAITVALNFGQMHIHAPAATALRVFTPTVIASPISINGGERDATFGLSLDDSLCVRAASGAIQIENQFSSEKIVIPQAGDFVLQRGELAPVAGTAGACACAAMPANTIPAPSPALALENGGAPGTAAAAPNSSDGAAQPRIEFAVPAANRAHPLARHAENVSADAPSVSTPIYKVIMPPLEFSADRPEPTRDLGPEMMLLVREAQVHPDWQFQGQVEPPSMDDAARPHGFWHALKKLFFL